MKTQNLTHHLFSSLLTLFFLSLSALAQGALEGELVAKHSGKCLEIAGGSQANGARIQQWDCNGQPHQLWRFEPTETKGVYIIVSPSTGKVLDVEGGSSVLGIGVSGVANGTNIISWQRHGGENQRWGVTVLGNNTYVFKPKHTSGSCLDIEGISRDNGAKAHLWEYLGGANQQWELRPQTQPVQVRRAETVQPRAPETGTITMSVTDTQGAPIAGARVRWVDDRTNARGSRITNGGGTASSSTVSPGQKTIIAEAPGYQSFTLTNIQVSEGGTSTVSFRLAPDNSNVANSGNNAPPPQPVESATPPPPTGPDIASRDANGDSLLHLAIRARQTNVAEDLISRGIDVNAANNAGSTALHDAVLSGDANAVGLLLRNRANANAADGRGATPIDYAVQARNSQMIESLLEAGADAGRALAGVEQMGDERLFKTILEKYQVQVDARLFESAVRNRHYGMAEAALGRGVDANQALAVAIKNDARTLVEPTLRNGANADPALRYAMQQRDLALAQKTLTDYHANADLALKLAAPAGELGIVNLALENGADPNGGMEDASRQGHVRIVEALLRRRANPESGMAAAAGSGQIRIIEMLLAAGANAESGMKAAVNSGQASIIGLLLQRGARGDDPNYIAFAASKGSLEITNLLLKAGASPDAGLAGAVRGGAADVAARLIEAGANAKAPEHILLACEKGMTAVARILLDNGAPVNVSDGRGQPLVILAALSWKADLVRLVLEKGADPNARNTAGETALHIVARDSASPGYPKFNKAKKGRLPALQSLIAGKADVNAVNSRNETVLKVADGGDVKDILKAAGAVKELKDLNK